MYILSLSQISSYIIFLFLWIIFSKGSASFEEEVEKEESTKATTTEPRTYEHDSEVWRGRLNQLWFDLANAKK